MNDTTPEIERKYREMLLQRSGEDRLKMGCSMHATAQALVRASVLEKDPRASPADMRRALFLRFYGHEFDAEMREKILLAVEGVGRQSRQKILLPIWPSRLRIPENRWDVLVDDRQADPVKILIEGHTRNVIQ